MICFCDTEIENFSVQVSQPKLQNIDPIIIHTQQHENDIWKMYFDATCCKEKNGAGVVFISPSEKKNQVFFLIIIRVHK